MNYMYVYDHTYHSFELIMQGKRVERHIERLQEKIMKQQEIIGNLKIDSEMLERLKVRN